MLAVPHIAITFSSLNEISRNERVSWQYAMFFIGFLACMTTIMCLASAIHQEVGLFRSRYGLLIQHTGRGIMPFLLPNQAHKPEEILSSQLYENEAFDRLSSRFTRRFRNKSFGYTFFGFFTFRKQTILSVSSRLGTNTKSGVLSGVSLKRRNNIQESDIVGCRF